MKNNVNKKDTERQSLPVNGVVAMAKQIQVDAQSVQVIHNMHESEGENNETPRTLKKAKKIKVVGRETKIEEFEVS